MDKGSDGRFFEDFQLGQLLECPAPRVVTHAERTQFIAVTGDRTPRYLDAEGLIHPLLIFNLAAGQSSGWLTSNLISDVGWADVRWHRPVMVGSTLRTSLKITGLQEDGGQESGTVWTRVSVRDHADQVVLTGTRWLKIRKRGKDATPWLRRQVTPHLKLDYDVSELVFPDIATIPTTGDTGGKWWFEDYFPGETVYHRIGLPTNRGEHTHFCLLFQDHTPRYLDHTKAGGRPKLSPGYGLSLAYSVAHNGLENRLGLVAINHLRRPKPISPGQIVYAMTQVRDMYTIDKAPYGAIRCRTFGIVDVAPPDGFIPVKGTEHHPLVVLDLDYWEIVSKMPFR